MMRFLCDVHISYKLKRFLQGKGYYCIHINEVLLKDRTSDYDIAAYCNEENLILISKDEDFLDTYLIKRLPSKLIKIHLGNISTLKLIDIVDNALSTIEEVENRKCFLIELYKNRIEISED